MKALLSLQEKKNSWLFGWGSFLKFSETEKKTKRQLSSDDAIKVLRENMRLRNYAISTEKTYISWVRKLFCFCNNNGMSFTQLQLCDPKLVKNFLAHLAIKRNVSASTQNQAFSSLLMFFRLVFHQELGDIGQETIRARTGRKLPVVFSVVDIKDPKIAHGDTSRQPNFPINQKVLTVLTWQVTLHIFSEVLVNTWRQNIIQKTIFSKSSLVLDSVQRPLQLSWPM